MVMNFVPGKLSIKILDFEFIDNIFIFIKATATLIAQIFYVD